MEDGMENAPSQLTRCKKEMKMGERKFNVQHDLGIF